MCKWLALIWNEIMFFSSSDFWNTEEFNMHILWVFQYQENCLHSCNFSHVKKKIKCYQSIYSHPYFSELTFQDTEDFNMYTFFVFWVVSNFFKCKKSQFSRLGLPVNSHANFTYSFPTLKIILIPAMTRSNYFWFISLDAHTRPPMSESQSLYVT